MQLEFTANATWSGSGDVSASRIGYTVDPGVTLTLNTIAGVKLISGSSSTGVIINGTLNVGTQVLTLNTCTFTLNAGATLITSNTTGAFQSSSSSTATLYGSGTITLSGNVVFSGTGNQDGTGLPTSGLQNLIVNSGHTVALTSAVAVELLNVSSTSILNLGTYASTAGFLSLDGGLTLKSLGTWGPGYANTDSHLTSSSSGTGKVTVSADSTTQFRSIANGNWNAPGTWQTSSDGNNWSANTTVWPNLGSQVFIQFGHTVTLTENEICGNLDMAFGQVSTDTGSGGSKVAVATYTLQLNGHLRAYYGTAVTTTGNTPLTMTDVGNGSLTLWSPFSKTSGSAGRIQVVGLSRALTVNSPNSTWATPNTSSTWPDIDFNLADANQTVTAATPLRFGNWTFTLGTFSTSQPISAENGTTGLGGANITIGPNAMVTSSYNNGSAFRRSSTATSGAFGILTVQGVLPHISQINFTSRS